VGTLVAVENPVRFGRLRPSAGGSLVLGGGLTAVGVCAALVALVVVPVPVGHGAAAAEPTIGGATTAAPTTAATTPTAPVDPYLAAVRRLTAQVQAAVARSVGVTAVPANLTPPLAAAPADKPAVFVNGCLRSWLYVGQKECATGTTASTTTVALVGDSHAAMWWPAFDTLAAQRRWRLETMAKVTCPLQDLPIRSPYLGREYTECVRWRGQILARLRAEHPRLIVLGTAHHYTPDFSFTVYSPQWLDSLTRTVAGLRSTGASVLVLGPIPHPQGNVPICLSDHLDTATACDPDRATVDDAGVAAEARATEAGGGTYADLTDLFCTAAQCPAVVGNTLVYRDDNHLTIDYARFLAPLLAAFIDRAMAAR
jgi:hypothetical protein